MRAMWWPVLVAACGGGAALPGTVVIFDGGDDDQSIDGDAAITCSLLTQTGCTTGQKCAWVLSTDPTSTAPGLGSIMCAPDGQVAIGGACTIQAAAMGGNDNCVGGNACVDDVCEAICNDSGGAPGCGVNHACVPHVGLFANVGVTPPAGVCDASCDPLADNDFDNVGTELTKSGSACGSDPLEGCAGTFTSTGALFNCFHTPAGATLLVHRQIVPATGNSVCAPGYQEAFATDTTGTMVANCYAYCKPGDAYLGNPNAQLPNGVSPHACNTTDARGNFGDVPNGSADSNGEHCFYSWGFQGANEPITEYPSSNSVGFCYDHSKYKYDPTGGENDNTVLPPCAALPLHSTTGLTAIDLACVSTTLANMPTVKKHKLYIPGWPEFLGRR